MQTYIYKNVRVVEQTHLLNTTEITEECKKLVLFKIKRVIDIFGSILSIIILLPVLIVIGFLIKVSSKGPIFFSQKRMGQNGQLFTFFKFRTMKQNCDDEIHRKYVTKLIKAELKNVNSKNNNKPLYKIDNDFRVTKVGRFLRTWSLDELPQLFNVLKGDMSLVGPRPPIPYEVTSYSAWHLQRLETLPGITGLWQIKGRSRTTFDGMVRLDIQYIRNWSLLLDFKILLKTIKVVFNRDGAL